MSIDTTLRDVTGEELSWVFKHLIRAIEYSEFGWFDSAAVYFCLIDLSKKRVNKLLNCFLLFGMLFLNYFLV